MYHNPYIISSVSYKYLYNTWYDMWYSNTTIYILLITFIIFKKNQIQYFFLCKELLN